MYMLRKITMSLLFVLICIGFPVTYAEDNKQIEILNIEMNQVIKTIPNDNKIQVETVKLLKEINGIVKAFRPVPNKGHMIKIPLEPTFHLENKWINAIINEVIVIVPEEEEPFLLLFDDENNSYFFTLEISTDSLLKLLGFTSRENHARAVSSFHLK